jgi:hypothetical protein
MPEAGTAIDISSTLSGYYIAVNRVGSLECLVFALLQMPFTHIKLKKLNQLT